MPSFPGLVRALAGHGVRFVVIGVSGANHYATAAGMMFHTKDYDLFLPPDPDNEFKALGVCEAAGLELWCGGEQLDRPRDLWLAEQVVVRRALVTAIAEGIQVDLTLVMAGFDFETVWREQRAFVADDVEIPVARLTHIVASKASAGRPKDRLFLATHAEALRRLVGLVERDG